MARSYEATEKEDIRSLGDMIQRRRRQLMDELEMLENFTRVLPAAALDMPYHKARRLFLIL